MRALAIAITLVACFFLLIGAESLTGTNGLGPVGFACFLGIVARMAQAAAHQHDLVRSLGGVPATNAEATQTYAPVAQLQPTPRWIVVLVVALAVGTLVMIGVTSWPRVPD